MAPPSQTFRRSDYDENDADGQLTQAPQSHGAGLGNNIGKLIQTQLASSEGDCFPGWDLYFPTTAYEESSASVATVKDFIKYFQTWSTQYTASVEKTLRDKFVEIYYSDVVEYGPLKEKLPDLVDDIRESPEHVINCLGLAFHTFVHEYLQQLTNAQRSSQAGDPSCKQNSKRLVVINSLLVSRQVPKIQVRLAGYENDTRLKDLRHNVYGRLISLKGSVVRVSNIRPFTTRMVFQCASCSQYQLLPLPDGRYIVPTKCASRNCRGKSFAPMCAHERNETINWQTIKVQEMADDMERSDEGNIPKTIECELTYGLVDSCVPGDLVTITGVVKLINSDQSKKAREKSLFMVYVNANNVVNHKAKMNKTREINVSQPRNDDQRNRRSFEKTSIDLESQPSCSKQDTLDCSVAYEHSPKEMEFISDFFDLPNKFQILVASLCPSIFGHEVIKASLLLGLVGGCQRHTDDPSLVPVRGDLHILIVGDPGLGKSQMLQAVHQVAPRSVFVCGNASTTAGLTVSITSQGQSGDLNLEAGALVLADQGCCCIDEFDKMSTQHQALLEAMEQQCISITKSGIIANLPARTSILAAANPIGGHYNRAKTVSENLKMSSALLSRFDLVFLLLDTPNNEMDQLLSEHVMKLHSKSGRESISSKNSFNSSLTDSLNSSIAARPSQSVLTDHWKGHKPLQARLKIPRGAEIELLPPKLLKSWIAYAKKYVVHVTLAPEAKKILMDYFLKLRRDHHTKDSTPITTRQLEAMMRLTEARAKLDLSETATEQHAQDIVDLMNLSMLQTQSDVFGSLDFERSQHGSGTSLRSLQKEVLKLILREKQQTGNDMINIERIKVLAKNCPQVRSVVERLNHDGQLIKKGPGLYKIESDC